MDGPTGGKLWTMDSAIRYVATAFSPLDHGRLLAPLIEAHGPVKARWMTPAQARMTFSNRVIGTGNMEQGWMMVHMEGGSPMFTFGEIDESLPDAADIEVSDFNLAMRSNSASPSPSPSHKSG